MGKGLECEGGLQEAGVGGAEGGAPFFEETEGAQQGEGFAGGGGWGGGGFECREELAELVDFRVEGGDGEVDFLAAGQGLAFGEGEGEGGAGAGAAAGAGIGALEALADAVEGVHQVGRQVAAAFDGDVVAFEPVLEPAGGAGEAFGGLLDGGEGIRVAAGVRVALAGGLAGGIFDFRGGKEEAERQAEGLEV